MRKIGIIILLTSIMMQAFSQELSAESQTGQKQKTVVNKDENTKFSVGNDLVVVAENDSAVNIRVGNRGLNILESLEGRKVNFEKYDTKKYWEEDDIDNDKENDKSFNHARKRRRFKGHWAGAEFGFNNYLTSDKSFVLPDDIDFMRILSSKSTNFNINFSQLSLGLSSHFGFVTGLGINWNNYKFSNNNNIQEETNGIIGVFDPGTPLKKSKLATVYLNVPFLLEIQIPVDHKHLNIAAGPIGAVKLGSHTKMVFEDGQKLKTNGDFSLNMLRYGATARAGYENFQIYGTYYATPLFRSGKGPGGYNLYPIEIGISFTIND